MKPLKNLVDFNASLRNLEFETKWRLIFFLNMCIGLKKGKFVDSRLK